MKVNIFNIQSYKYNVEPQTFIDDWQKGLGPDTPEAKKLSVPEFMDVVNEISKISNLDAIWATYDDWEKEKYKNEYSNKNLPYIKPNTPLSFPIKDSPLLIQKASKSDMFMKQRDFSAYWSENLTKLLQDKEGYVADNVVALDEEMSVRTKVQPINIKVWIYCKAINKVVDVSQFVNTCSTDKGFKNGAFSINITPFKDANMSNVYGAGYYDIFPVVTPKGYDYKSYLEKVVQINDIVFIRFERLRLEGSSDSENANDLFVPLNKLANNGTNYNVWDMIGFVDSVMETYSSEDNSKSTVISGRDIAKMFVEDGSYFIPLENVNDTIQNWLLRKTGGVWNGRNVFGGEYQFVWNLGYKTINECIWFIINIMSSIGVCSDEVFSSWGDKRITAYSIPGQQDLKVRGIWQIVKLQVSGDIMERIVTDTGLGNPNGTLMQYMERICQYPLTEFFFDTYINTIDVIVRQPPFTEKAIKDAFKSENYITITPDNVISYNLSYDPRVYTWFQLHAQNAQVGGRDKPGLAFVPIVYLEEYVERWGNRKMDFVDMYCIRMIQNGAENPKIFSTYQATMLNDLIYLVESNMYVPFTRCGTIEINGDRRIKVGTFVLNQSTNEFFYVTNVTNTISFNRDGVDRRTVLQVERGFYVPILKGNLMEAVKRNDNSVSEKSASGFTPDYFKLVDLSGLRQKAKEAESGQITSYDNPTVDKQQFDYFLNRKYFGGME